MKNIIKVISAGCMGILTGIFFGGYWMGHKYCVKLMDSRHLVDKHLYMVRLYDIWMMTKQNGASIEKYLMDQNIYKIAIYGMSYMGIRLFHELRESSVCVAYGIDRDLKIRIPELEIYHPDEVGKKEIDAIIVTAVYSFDSIEKSLKALGFSKIIAFDEILYDLVG